jgi:metal-responsive CopG/Arc/MetJ family transcriptional regulator
MSVAKVAISVDNRILKRLDRLVEKHFFPSRSRAIAEALEEKLVRIDKSRLARECLKLDKKEENVLAEEGIA